MSIRVFFCRRGGIYRLSICVRVSKKAYTRVLPGIQNCKQAVEHKRHKWFVYQSSVSNRWGISKDRSLSTLLSDSKDEVQALSIEGPQSPQGSPNNMESFASFTKNGSWNTSTSAQECNNQLNTITHTQGTFPSLNLLNIALVRL